MTTPPVRIGDVLADKYIIEHTLGEGGMGVVYAARHTELERRVAIKFLLPEFAEHAMAAERFRREARAVARMHGEHVCRVLDVGTLESGIPFMVMEHLDGGDLASELARRGRLPLTEAVGYVLEACEAVAEAHAAGIIHRDLKPANLFLENRADGSRRIKVLDFGVSKSLLERGDGSKVLTTASSLVGSPLYMSPEQLECARDVDVRADIWALGVVLYELLMGVPPFQGETIPQLVAAVLQATPMRPLDDSVPAELTEVVQRALAKRRDDRYSSVAELALALAPFAPSLARSSISRVRRLLEARSPTLQQELEAPAALDLQARSVSPIQETKSAAGVTGAGSMRNKSLWAGVGLGIAVALLLLMLRQAAFEREADSEPKAVEARAPTPASQLEPAPVRVRVIEPRALARQLEAGTSASPSPSEPPAPQVPELSPARPLAGAQSNVAEPAPAVPWRGDPHEDAQAPTKQGLRAQGKLPPSAAETPRAKGPSTPEAAPDLAAPSRVSDFGGRR